MRTSIIIRTGKHPRKRKNIPYADDYNTTFSAGGILASTGSGAAMGATVGGPWGAVIGGVIGAGVGVYQHTQERKAEKEQDAMLRDAKVKAYEQRQATTARIDSSIYDNYRDNFNNSLYYGNGGTMNNYPSQSRGIQQVNSTDAVANGPNHEQGGIPINGGNEVEGGENIRQNPNTGEVEVDSKRLGTAQANQPLMQVKAVLEQKLQMLKSLKAKAFLAKTKAKDFRKSNSIDRKVDTLEPEIQQLEQQLNQVQQQIEANFQQQQAVNGNSQGSQNPNPNNPNPGQPMMDGSGQGIGLGQNIGVGSRNQFAYGGVDDTYDFNKGAENYYQFNNDQSDRILPTNGIYTDFTKWNGDVNYYNPYGNKISDEITTGKGFNTYNSVTYKPDVPTRLATSTGTSFGTPVGFGQGKGVMGNATLGVDTNIGTGKVLPVMKDGKLTNSNENIVLPRTQDPPSKPKNLAIGPTGASAIGQGVAGIGTYMANQHYINRLKKTPLDTLDRQVPLLYTTNLDNTNRTLIERQITEARRAYQENPTPANEARLRIMQEKGYTALATNESARRSEINTVNNANRQEVNAVANANTGIDKYNSILKYNKSMAILNAEQGNTQGLINDESKAFNTAIGGINTNRRLQEESKRNPDSVLSKSFVKSDYSWGNDIAVASDLQMIAAATPGSARDKKYQELKEVSGRTDEEMKAILSKYNINYIPK